MSDADPLAAVKKAGIARKRAEANLATAKNAEDIAIQDAYAALGPGYGNVAAIAKAADRDREHVRRVLKPTNGRGRHATTPDA